MRGRAILAVGLAAGLALGFGGCRGLTPLELDHLVQGEVEARLADGLRAHHADTARSWPAVILAVALDDPEEITDADLQAAFFESMRGFLASPRLRGTTTPEPRYTLEMALRNLGMTDENAWDALADASVRARVNAEFLRLGGPVDYFARGTLAWTGLRYRLRLELRDAATWAMPTGLDPTTGTSAATR